MVDGIVRAHGGRVVRLASRVNVGTRFRILLPAADLPSSTPDHGARPALQPGTEHVMVVDDKEVIRDMILRILEPGVSRGGLQHGQRRPALLPGPCPGKWTL